MGANPTHTHLRPDGGVDEVTPPGKPRVLLVGNGTSTRVATAMLAKATEAGHDVEIVTMDEARDRGLLDAEPAIDPVADMAEDAWSVVEQLAPKKESRANPHLTSLATGAPMPRFPGGRIQPVKVCPTCGSEGRGRYCTENGHHKRRVARKGE